jgi:hypothetical protein
MDVVINKINQREGLFSMGEVLKTPKGTTFEPRPQDLRQGAELS